MAKKKPEKTRKRKRGYEPALLSHEHARFVVKRIAMTAVDLMMLLESYTLDSGPCVDDIMSLQGYMGRLFKMLNAKVKHDVRVKIANERVAEGP